MKQKEYKGDAGRKAEPSAEQDENDLSIFTTLVEVSYATDGTPSVEPASCFAPEGNEVVWRGGRGESRPFRIVFASANPSDSGAPTDPLTLDSRFEQERQTCSFRTRKILAQDRQFQYTIEANGIVVDADLVIQQPAEAPVIIVGP